MTRVMKLGQLVGGFVYEQNEAGEHVATHETRTNPKLAVLEEILDEVLPNKVIVWCRFRWEAKIITEAMGRRAATEKRAGRKFSFAAIHGGVPQKERGQQVTKFQEDESCRVFVGTVPTAGLGITLTAASCVVYYSNDYSLENRLQSEDRNHRIGQKKSVTYIDVLGLLYNGKPTVDQDVRDAVTDKKAFANEVSKALVTRLMGRSGAAAPAEVVVKAKAGADEMMLGGDEFDA